MNFIDTHCHLYLEEFDQDQTKVIEKAKEVGVNTFLLPNVDKDTVKDMLQLYHLHPECFYPMMGLHPTSVKSDYISQLKEIESYLYKAPFIAIGEIGIDLYWDKTFLKEQKIVFEEQLQWSIDMNLPVSIHTREAFDEVLDSIYKIGANKLKGVFHSFSGDAKNLKDIMELKNFKLGINGVITFKNSGLADVIEKTSIDEIVLETDAPYLSPVPYRGKRNEPSYIIKTAEKISQIFHITIEEVANKTTANASGLFTIVNNPI